MATDWSWYALQVEPACEFRARAYLLDPDTLGEQGLDDGDLHVLMPLRHTLSRPTPVRMRERRPRPRGLIARPRLPGYLFMGLQPERRPIWRVILSLPHIQGVLGHGAPEPVASVKLLIAMLPDLQLLIRKRRRHKLRPVEIRNGPYEGEEVGVIEVAGDDPEVYGVMT